MSEVIGWVATALFAGSYFLKRPASLRRRTCSSPRGSQLESSTAPATL